MATEETTLTEELKEQLGPILSEETTGKAILLLAARVDTLQAEVDRLKEDEGQPRMYKGPRRSR